MAKIRLWIAGGVVGSWAVGLVLLLALTAFGGLELEDGLKLLQEFASISSGVVGVVVGYYFTGSNRA